MVLIKQGHACPTLIGRLSINNPLSSLAALAAVSGRTKVMAAIPRLEPFWLYVTTTFLTGPADWWKYSYYASNASVFHLEFDGDLKATDVNIKHAISVFARG